MHPQLRVQLPGLPYSPYNLQAHSPCPTSRVSYEKDNNTHLDKSDTPNVPTDKYNNKEIERLTGFAEMPNVSDVRSIREQVKRSGV